MTSSNKLSATSVAVLGKTTPPTSRPRRSPLTAAAGADTAAVAGVGAAAVTGDDTSTVRLLFFKLFLGRAQGNVLRLSAIFKMTYRKFCGRRLCPNQKFAAILFTSARLDGCSVRDLSCHNLSSPGQIRLLDNNSTIRDYGRMAFFFSLFHGTNFFRSRAFWPSVLARLLC